MNTSIAKPESLAIFPDVPGKRIWRQELYRPLNWRPDSDEKEFGPKTDFPNGVHIVTVSENIPAERIELFRKASFAARRSGYDFSLGDNYDAAVAVYNGRIAGLAWADRNWRCERLWRLNGKPHRKFDPGTVVAGKTPPTKRDPNKIYGRPAVMPTKEELQGSVPSVKPPFRPMVRGVWVHPAYRGMGIGRQLISAFGQHFNIRVDELGFRLPVSAKAARMLQAMGLETIFGSN